MSRGDDMNAKGVRMLPATLKYTFLPQNEELSSSMGFGWDLLKEPTLAPFEVEVAYEDLSAGRQSQPIQGNGPAWSAGR